MTAADDEITRLRASVARHFSVSGVVVTPLALTFQVAPAVGSADDAFDGLRKELVPMDYIPSLTRERGELLLHVQRRPPQRYTTVRVNAVMLLVTIVTTIFFGGAWNWSGYTGEPLLSADSLLYGTVYFTLPLLAILGFHEMGHYLVAKRYNMRASLPFFLPSVPPLGTFGAFISMRDPMPSRRALLDVGASGPLVGFAIAIPLTIAGLFLTAANPHAVPLVQGTFEYPQPSAFYWFLKLFIPVPDTVALHPLAFAGWVGLFVTAINLLPAGQLDGGHVARALLGDRQVYVSWAAVLLLFAMSTFYLGWLIFAFLILMLGVRHPPPLNDLSRLKPGRTLVGVAAVAILLATFIPQPFLLETPVQSLAFQDAAGNPITQGNATATSGASTTITVYVAAAVAAPQTVSLSIDPRNLNHFGYGFTFASAFLTNGTAVVSGSQATIVFNATDRAVVGLRIDVPTGILPGPVGTFVVTATFADTGDSAQLAIALTVS